MGQTDVKRAAGLIFGDELELGLLVTREVRRERWLTIFAESVFHRWLCPFPPAFVGPPEPGHRKPACV